MTGSTITEVPARQIRAAFDDETVTVYQAYPPEIAEPALAARTFVPPFKAGRMTWIKPSFLWMMYRSGFATKPGQERVLAIRIARSGFEEALAEACLSHYDPDVHADRDDWSRCKEASDVRVQWDPERSLDLDALPWRAIQIGLARSASTRYVAEWINELADVTSAAHTLRRLLDRGDRDEARRQLPVEEPYPLPTHIARIIGATPVS